MTARQDPAVERAAARAGRDRPARSVQVGCWVYAYGPAGGQWQQVTAITAADGGRVRFGLLDSAGDRAFVETAPAAPAFCLSPTAARRAGLTT